jgi:hypothetical protein
MWIMDDVSPLQQFTPQTATTAAVLFKPRDVIRGRLGGGRGGFGGGGRGAAPGQAEFPPYGATIDYYLAQPASGPLTIDILDAAGRPIRTYSSEATTASNEEAPAANSDEESGPARRGPPPVRLTTHAGMNRLTWDFNNSNGIMVPPGTYQVKLSGAGATSTASLALKMDPRLVADNVTVADLKEQYDHNVRMHDMVAEVNRVANRVRQARTQLRSSGDAAKLAAVNALAVTLFGPDEGVRYGRPGLQTQITYLAGMTTRADQRIGRDAVERYATLRKELDALEARVNQTLGVEK